MKRFLKWLVSLAIVCGLAFAACRPMLGKFSGGAKTNWRTAQVSKGRILYDVRATGKLKPVLEVSIGAFVSGPITDLYVDFNQIVKEGELLARIDTRLYEAAVARDQASLITRQADVDRVNALYQQAVRNEQRAIALREENEDFISPREMDGFHFERMSLEAQLKVAKASVKQAEAALETSMANLGYTEIRAPVDGIVIDRKISRGQTLASQFQTPELFIMAPDLEKKMHVEATIDEADVGRIIQAKQVGLPVEFTVSAYPDDTFYGEIEQIRKNSTTTENVVTYPVVVAAPNPDLKLLPGMTANLSFQVDERTGVIRVPNSALRFYPPDRNQVREEDREILDGDDEEEDDEEIKDTHLSDEEKAARKKKRATRYVWAKDGEFLKAIKIEIGLVGWKHSELVEGDLNVDDELVIGEKIGG
ncbi:MAG: efflux RND transporter periplasmic adaptor subunit [Planctomycetota bacterium]